MAKVFSELSDQLTTVEEKENNIVYTIYRYPVCWGRANVEHPVCFLATELLQDGVKWVSGGHEFRVKESKSIAMGDEVCEFIIQKDPIG